ELEVGGPTAHVHEGRALAVEAIRDPYPVGSRDEANRRQPAHDRRTVAHRTGTVLISGVVVERLAGPSTLGRDDPLAEAVPPILTGPPPTPVTSSRLTACFVVPLVHLGGFHKEKAFLEEEHVDTGTEQLRTCRWRSRESSVGAVVVESAPYGMGL